MITHHLPLQPFIKPQPRVSKPVSSPAFRHRQLRINNFIANMFSKILLPLFAGFYSPLKHLG